MLNNWDVSYSTIVYVERALRAHVKVRSFRRSKDIMFDIELVDGESIRMVLVNEYTLGLAAVHAVLAEFPGVGYIVTSASWNGYTREAKEFGNKNDVGIFVFGEFFGSLHWKEPKKYHTKDEDGNPTFSFKIA